ncbi:MAG: hypothetical protein AAFR66_01920 [Bacteroidota bacterium]
MKTSISTHTQILTCLGAALLMTLVGVGMISKHLIHSFEVYQKNQLPLQKIAEADQLSLSNKVTLAQLTQKANVYQPDKVEVQSHLQFVDYLSKACNEHQLQMVSMPKETTKEIENYIISEEKFSLRGSFRNVLNLIYQLEYQDRIGRLTYLVLERKVIRTLGKQRQYLIVDVTLKRVENQQKI